MIIEIIFAIIAFLLVIFVTLFKLIKKNDATYIIILAIQTIGILINLVRITTNMLTETTWTAIMCTLGIVIPLIVIVLESMKINISALINIISARICIILKNTKKAKVILINLTNKYNNSYLGHKMLANIYSNEGGMRKAIDEYVKVLDIKKNDYQSYYKISVLLKELNRTEEAIDMLKNLLKHRPETYEATQLLRPNIYRTRRI